MCCPSVPGIPAPFQPKIPISIFYLNSGITSSAQPTRNTQAQTRKESPTMSLAINKNFFLLVILAFLTLLVVTFVVLAMVAHVNLLHLGTSFTTLPDVLSGSH
jgi:hypothetical protein